MRGYTPGQYEFPPDPEEWRGDVALLVIVLIGLGIVMGVRYGIL
jgi:hypothetical protein